ncbi:hypothetical protein [uncultured Rheinheimera sp.]|uniref:hypothetical protein n=1 Tax=uncultured Rheinheimera sp. TaxID=400532 RepID=UPI002597339F|nr:hypothetical protein [uncultured Rheinheimera sp.]
MKRKRKSTVKGIGGPYIHISRNLDQKALKDIEFFLEKEVAKLTSDKFSDEISIHVKVIDGSIKAYVVLGGLTLYNLVSGYGSLRSGIDTLVKDVQSVSSMAIDIFSVRENVLPHEIIHQERRLGIPGKVQRYLKKLDRLDDQDINAIQRKELVGELKVDLLDILVLLEHECDRTLVIEASPPVIQHSLPVRLPPPDRGALDLRFEIENLILSAPLETPNRPIPSTEYDRLKLITHRRDDDDGDDGGEI